MQHLNSELGSLVPHPLADQAGRLFPREAYRMGVPAGYVAKLATRHSPPEFRPHSRTFSTVGHVMGQVTTSLFTLAVPDPIQICRGILIKLRKLSKKVFRW